MSQRKSVLITGCSDGGIGSALAKAFHDKGIHVFATARQKSKMKALGDLPNITFLELDVTSSESIAAAQEAVSKERNGTLDYLVNNSGSGYVMTFLDSDLETSQRMFDVNVWGVARVTQAFASLLIAAKGTIVNNASTAACLGLPYQSMYCGSKAAVRLMSEAMALEMKPLGVRVVTIITGNVRSVWFSNQPEFIFPPGSYYTAVKDKIGIYSRGEQGHPQTDPKVYAEKVVGDILGGAPGTIWRGAQSYTVRYALPWVPDWLKSILAVKGSGLDTWNV
ncbi:oxidoreductase [Penicillium angulare]|uniref:oxidoreductase n=1 Tax=Penicillium angulare TaxID=116970 RepID=UPI00254260EC|nr:oxidoreductase [Penicillium angulare]KAJ5266890.1 oxidoreductase [Penicillium angulare]